jgi:MtrB/PioB family decaheme-associated outer membrane protein
MKQDDKLLPYTTNAAIPVSPLPAGSVDGEVDTTNIELRATSMPVAKFTVDGRFRYDQRDNKTPERTYDYVVTDFAPAPEPVKNIAYDYDRYQYELGGEYRFNSRTRLHAGLEHEDFKRSDQERKHTRTNRLSTRLDTRSIEILDLNFEVFAERRRGSDYDTIESVPDPQNPRMRLYNMADRDRHGVKSYLSLLAGQRGSIGVNFEASKDEYKNVSLGLEHSSYAGFGVDLSWLLARDIMAYATTHWEQSKSKQDNSQDFAAPDWTGKTNDKYFTTSVGLKYPDIIRKLTANVEYTYARSKGDISNDTSGLESDFPTVKTRFHQFRLGLEYPYNTALSLKFGYLFQKYKANDWALDGVSADTVPNLLSLGADAQHYTNHVFFLGVKYTFDSRNRASGSNAAPRLSAAGSPPG